MSLYQSLALTQDQLGKRCASGTFTPTAVDTEIVTGLDLVDCVIVTFKEGTNATHLWSFALPSVTTDGSITVSTQKATAVDDVTPTDASTPWVALSWFAIGD
jgi:hypothetical protein